MILRLARPEDAQDICAIANPIIRDTLITFTTVPRSVDEVRRDIAAHEEGFQIAEAEGRVIGFASLGTFRSGPGYALTREHSIQLDRAARGRGVGRALMQRLESIAIAQSVHVLVAGISSANPGAIAFHAALGFALVGQMPQVGFKAGQWLDLILMQKILPVGPDGAPDTGPLAG